jgi:hypothetical protein
MGCKKNPVFFEVKRGLPCDRKEHYLFALLDALSGLIFTLEPLDSEAT